jgi:hypothetical protein
MSNIDNTFHNDISLNTSMSNISTFGNGDEFNQRKSAIGKPSFDINRDTNTNEQKEINFDYGTFNNKAQQDVKKRFYKKVLQVKLEKLHNSHKGISIDPKILFAECQKLKIPEDKWEEFILNEMTNPNKYLNILKNKRKLHKPVSKKPSMGIIQEEE